MKRFTLLILFIITQVTLFGQSNNATLKGILKDTKGIPLDMVTVVLKEYPTLGTTTNAKGEFLLRVPAKKPITVIFSSIGYKTFSDSVYAQPDETVIKEIVMPAQNLELAEIIVNEQRRNAGNIISLDPKIIDIIPNASGSLETMLKTFPGVSSNNELSSQYNVRGGNFDENLVYVNDIEVYRPFLIRAGQQEGMSFINSDMVSTVDFSAGGFNAKYGDKMSSVLDIKYRKPSDFKGSASASMLGATAHFEDVAFNGKLTHISGIRYKTNRYLLGTLDEQGEYDPRFFDFQTYITFQFNEKFEVSFLGNIAQNQYNFIPQTRQTTFGTWQAPLSTKIYFNGQEVDDFKTYLGAVTFSYHPNADLNLKFIASSYHAKENETYDIEGQYYLNQLERNMSSEEFGDSTLNLGIGTFLNHARNNLEATVYNFSHKGALNSENHLVNWGVKYQHEEIKDKLNEWIYRDSTGYSLPYSDSQVLLYYSLNAKNHVRSNRITGYAQDSWSVPIDESKGDLYFTGGVRFNYWDFNNELLVSPRVAFSYFPNWEKKMSFRFAAGMYHQSPFFKELKNSDGSINYDAKAQKSYQLVGGTDLIFTAWNRPFRFTTEAYYKYMSHLTPYDIDNVQIRYRAEESSRGYATGLDMKINGEFVSGLQSWAGLSILNTKEDVENDGHGYLPRPTNQWVNFSMFFQDYLPGNPSYKMQLTGFYGTRLPTWSRTGDRYESMHKIPPYRRIDLGFSKVFLSAANRSDKAFFKNITDLWLSLEVFNLLDINNTISYFWVSSNSGDQYAVPNYLTGRKFNLKLTVKF